MVWAMNWFVYEPGTQLVHLERNCAYVTPPVVRRNGWQRVGNSSLATMDEAVGVARGTLDPEAQPCSNCRREFGAD